MNKNQNLELETLVEQFEKNMISLDELQELCGGIAFDEELTKPVPVI